ncbi:MAG TPA: DNA-directed RNA polymerase subunit omega [Pyrinomonadaceae bacterium]|nr:DNA-directed RNA polymerase subunit omega [Pyrinomonadaceae bacterium]
MSESKLVIVPFDPTASIAPGIDSRFRLIIIAGRRTKQLLRGAKSRVEENQHRRKGTSIALEEVKRGLIRFSQTADEL